MIIRWIIILLSVFQTQFYLTNRALGWLLNIVFVLLRFLGRYSAAIAELAGRFPRSLHQYGNQLPNFLPRVSFERRAVCKSCDKIYTFEDCVEKVGTSTYAIKCTSRHFKKTCNQPMMREIKSSNGTTKFYPHKVYGFVSLIASLQALVMRSGFVEQCESTRNLFSTYGLSDIYDGYLWQDFLTINNTAFLSECYNYGLLLNIDWLQPY